MRCKLPVALVICLVPSALLAGDDNPYKKAKIGDWIEYKLTGTIQGTTKMTVVAKDDKEVALEVTGTYSFMGKESAVPKQIQKIDLTKDYDAISAANLKSNNTKIDKVGEGTEKLKVGGKEFATKWTKLKSTTEVQGVTVVNEFKMWFSKDVPLGGLVRMDTGASGVNTKLELVGSGSK
jgi:hypothetical protein